MADDPSEEDISLVVEITQADRDTAIKYLKVSLTFCQPSRI